MSLIQKMLQNASSLTTAVRANVKSPAARAIRHAGHSVPRAAPQTGKIARYAETHHVTGTIPDKNIAHRVVDAFDGRGTLIDGSTSGPVDGLIDRMSR